MSCGRALLVALALSALPAAAVEDLRALEVRGLRGQSQEQARRDRYECHNWSVEQTGGRAPPAASLAPPPVDAKADLKHERIGRAIVGATIGGVVGSLFGDWHDQNENVLAGAAVGAGIGAATAGGGRKDAPPAPEGPSDYLRALTACLEGRGYSVSLPGPELTASR
ncbi:MAG TPA: glycine zipper 2TM domain-containing protein [Gammaproteobacteria bacterium]